MNISKSKGSLAALTLWAAMLGGAAYALAEEAADLKAADPKQVVFNSDTYLYCPSPNAIWDSNAVPDKLVRVERGTRRCPPQHPAQAE